MRDTKQRHGRVRRIVASVLVVVFAAPLAAATGIPVIDYLNLAENILQQINTYLSYIVLGKQLIQMLKDGEYFSFLMTLLNELEEFYPDTDVGQFAAEINEARDAWTGVTGAYGDTKGLMNDIFGGEEELSTSSRWSQIEFMDAASVRAAKEVGTFRSKRAQRKAFMSKMQAKANGSTGADRQLQLANSNLINIYGAISDMSMMQSTTNELLATQVQDRRAQVYREELAAKASKEALELLAVEVGDAELPMLALP